MKTIAALIALLQTLPQKRTTMTIRVKIENKEGENGRTITVSTVERPRTYPHETVRDKSDVRPGASREFYVHTAQHLIVEELP